MQSIEDFLKNDSFKYIMYRGGAGGEFLAYLIGQFSDSYEATGVSKFPYNRWNLEVPILVNAVALSRVKEQSIESLIQRIEQYLAQKNVDITQTIRNLNNKIGDQNKKHLFRAHISKNEYFYGRTYFLNIESQKWFDYCNWLQYIKVGSGEIDLHTPEFERMFLYGEDYINGYEKLNPFLTRTANLMMSGEIKGINNVHLDLLNSPEYLNERGINESNLHQFLSKSLMDLKEEFYDYFFSKFDSSVYRQTQSEIIVNFSPIQYDRLFEKGYLENMFNINNDEFHENLMKWHRENLTLLKQFSFDVSNYE